MQEFEFKISDSLICRKFAYNPKFSGHFNSTIFSKSPEIREISCNNSMKLFSLAVESPWRNRLARSAVNRKDGGSRPPGDVTFAFLNQHGAFIHIFIQEYCICSIEANATKFGDIFINHLATIWLGSISAALSSPVFVPPREERGREGEELGLISRTGAGNRAYNLIWHITVHVRFTWRFHGNFILRSFKITFELILTIFLRFWKKIQESSKMADQDGHHADMMCHLTSFDVIDWCGL